MVRCVLSFFSLRNVSRDHTTHFYLGKNDLPRANIHQKFPEVNSSRVSFPPGKKIRKGHTTEINTWGCHVFVSETRSIDRLEINSKMQPKDK